MITKKAGDLWLKIGFSQWVGNGRSRKVITIEKDVFNIFTLTQRIYS